MIDATIAKRGVISDEELLVICLKNAPEGTDRKQVLRLIKRYEDAPNLIVIPQQGVLFIEEELEDPPKYLEGLDKLSKRKSPWEDNECKHSTS